ncbi:MAG: Orotate phosphoribosyltransferase [Archaeoglobus fulgidus]|jgi:orotate phosphoribosyltransferase|nr:orotate phosphoribosyltransferase [Archaeoglobus fulgidus]AIG98742.1 orotate phosphoribosyltransferase [Archaeoglobus fulgidus DSM 8774]KUJ93556.1 MAG: Orotate phosphoribosyltransferase [Archaeoglobus fulgidus]KUK06318.1 MAG: Orotate phosphoribosyltransferase [Archaeoglobus fulgidus]
MLADALVKRMIEVGALKFGDFVLSSGKRSRVYVDVKLASTFPDILEMISEGMAAKLKDLEFDRIACVELGGVPIAVALSLKMKKPLVIFRKEKKDYGIKGDRIGEVKEGEKVVVVEDVITTGSSALSAARRVEESGASVAAIIAVVDREESGRNFMSLLKLSDLIEAHDSIQPTES